MENFDGIVASPELKRTNLEAFIGDSVYRHNKYLDQYQVIHTSGTTGRIGIFVYGREEWALVKALTIARVAKPSLHLGRKTRLAFIGATDGHYAGVSLSNAAPQSIFSLLSLSISSPLRDSVARLNAFQPDSVSGYASATYLLAEEQLTGQLNIHPRRIICSGDLLTPAMRAKITEAFGVQPTNLYAASEAMVMGAECDAHGGTHLFTDWYYFEVVNNEGQVVPEGEMGTLVVTPLYNYTQPLVRYKMNDQIAIDLSPCGCASPFPRLKAIAGRKEDALEFVRVDGSREQIHPIVIAEFFAPGLKRFQLVQTSLSELTMRAVVEGDQAQVQDAIRTRMHEIMAEKQLLDEVTFSVEVVQEILNDPKTGKFKLTIPFK